jgi:hypothetical protein
VARKADAIIDPQTLTVLEQLQTKTVGPPPPSSGLTGDQLPTNIISIDDLDLVKNQINLEVNNLEAINALTTVAAIAGLQGYGPIIDSGEITQTAITGSGSGGKQKIATPRKGQVIQVQAVGAEWNTSPGATVTFGFYIQNDETDAQFLIGTISSSSTLPGLDANEFLRVPFNITYPMSLRATVSTMGSASSVTMSTYNVRVK